MYSTILPIKTFFVHVLVTGVPGVLANDASTVTYVFKALLNGAQQNVYDPETVPIPWNDKVLQAFQKFEIVQEFLQIGNF